MSDPVAAAGRPGVSVWNIANALTFLRLLLVPVFAVLLLARRGARRTAGGSRRPWSSPSPRSPTGRRRARPAPRLITDFGKIVDPIADKALIGTALVGLSWLGELSWWVTVIVLVREIGVTALRFVVIRHGVMPASRGGKVKTLLQAVAIGLYLLPLEGPGQDVAAVVMAAAVVVTVVTGVDYVARAMRLRRTSERAQRKRAERAARRRAMSRRRDASTAVTPTIVRRSRPPPGWPRRDRPGVDARSHRRGRRVADRRAGRRPLAAVPGASQALRGGVVAYATELKADLLASTRRCSRGAAPSTPRWPRPWPPASAPDSAPTSGSATTGVAGPTPRTASRRAPSSSPSAAVG